MMPSKDAFRFVSLCAYVDAMRQGQDAVNALQSGDLFLGAWPAAEAAGYPRKSLLADMFTSGYLHAIKKRWPHGVTCTQNNEIY